jgi:hypothetical protein
MRQIKYLSLLLILFLLAACQPQADQAADLLTPAAPTVETAETVEAPSDATGGEETATPEVAATATIEQPGQEPEPTAPPMPTEEAQEHADGLPLLPPFPEANSNGIGDPLPGGEEDPFSEAVFTLTADLPQGPETAAVQEHTFGLMDEAQARVIADNLGFSGPLYVQQIAPEFAPADGEDQFSIFTTFEGSRILNLSDNGVTLEDRSVIVDYNNPPTFAELAPLVEGQLQEWGLLDFPYQITDIDDSVVMVQRVIDGIPNNQNEFNMFFNEDGELNYFDYHPLREITELGNYPLQTAEMAWQQIQQPAGRETIRYQVWPLQPALEGPIEGFVNPRSWAPFSDPGQELHLSMTPVVYEATDGSGLRLMYGDFTMAAGEDQLAEMAAHLADVLHVWGTADRVDGAKVLNVAGWEQVDIVNYETIEGTVQTQEDGQRVLQSITGQTFILPAVPDDLEDGQEVYVSVMAQRDAGADHPLLDWNSITEKIEWPEAPVATPGPEPDPISEVVVDEAELIYFTLYQTADVPGQDTALLLLPVWQFSGQSNQGQGVTLWVPAVLPEYFEAVAANS